MKMAVAGALFGSRQHYSIAGNDRESPEDAWERPIDID